MTGTPTAVAIGMREVLTARLQTAFNADAAAYRNHELPVGGIASFPAIRMNEMMPVLDDVGCNYDQDVELWLLHEDTAIVAEGRANIVDTLYAMQAEVMHALVDAEDTNGVIGGVACSVVVGRGTLSVDDTEGWMVIPLTLNYSRTAGEA